jgi:membrane dipeptidase
MQQDTASSSRFDVALSTAEQERAQRLHSQSTVIDLLSQNAGGNIFAQYPKEMQSELAARLAEVGGGLMGFVEAVYWPYEMSKAGRSDLIREWYRISGLTCGTYGINVHDGHEALWNRWEYLAERYADLPWLRYVTTAAEIRRAKQDGVVAFYGHCQPIAPVPSDLRAFDTAYAKGLRSFMLTYNVMNNIGVGCTERVDAGLSMFGTDVVRHCNDVGMIVDVSHCGRLTTLDACRLSKRPVNANHTAAKAVYSHVRGKSDEELKAIADTGGVVGVVAVPAFLTDAPVPTIDHMLEHIRYIAGLIGWKHVAIGTDWPLQAPDGLVQAMLAPGNSSIGFRKQDRVDATRRLVGFDDCRDLPNITRGLVKMGCSDEQARGILGENALRVFEEVCG